MSVGRGVACVALVMLALTGCGKGMRSEGPPPPRKTDTTSAPASHGVRRVLVYFARPDSCAVDPFPREVPEGDSLAVVRATLQALLDGPTAEEAAKGVHSAIPDTLEILRHRMRYVVRHYDEPHHGRHVEIQKLEPRPGGILYVSFSAELTAYDRGSTRVCSIIREVQDTVRQFREWKGAMIAIDDKTEGILQP